MSPTEREELDRQSWLWLTVGALPLWVVTLLGLGFLPVGMLAYAVLASLDDSFSLDAIGYAGVVVAVLAVLSLRHIVMWIGFRQRIQRGGRVG